MNRPPSPPRLAVRLLRLFLRGHAGEFIAGDLNELYGKKLRTETIAQARRWYWKQVIRCLFSSETTQQARQEPTQQKGDGLMQNFLQDVRYGMRMLARKPMFTVVVVATLALGIGANTAMFSIVNGVLLRPLPYPESEQLVRIHTQWKGFGFGSMNPLEYFDILERTSSFESVGIYRNTNVNLFEGDGEPERIGAIRLTPGVFETLRVRPAIGRMMRPEEAFVGSHRVAYLSDRLWRRRFGADPEIIGRSLRILNDSYEIIGVMPADFAYPRRGRDIWVGYGIDRENMGERGSHSSSVIARLRSGLSPEQAQADLDTLSAQLRGEFPANYPEATKFHFFSEPYLHTVTGNVRPALLVLMGAVAFVLLIACANVANLMLAHMTGREKEIVIRTALGAGRGQLIRQMLTESLLLSLLGGAAALVVSHFSFQALAWAYPGSLPRMQGIDLDGNVLAFNFGLVLLTTVGIGLIPAFKVSRTDLQSGLREGGRQSGTGIRRGARQALAITEVALATVLLVGAGLMIRSFQEMMQVDPGFTEENLLTLRVNLPSERYSERDARTRFFSDLFEELEAQPGVIKAAATNALPASGWRSDWSVTGEGYTPPDPSVPDFVQYRIVSPHYFETMGIRILRGQAFTDQDAGDSQPVVIVSEALAQKFWGTTDAVGKRVKPGGPDSSAPWHTVVGVVDDVFGANARAGKDPIWYRPLYRQSWLSSAIVVRTQGEPAAAIRLVKAALGNIDSKLPVYDVKVMTTIVEESLAQESLQSDLLIAFAALALGLAAIGTYGVISYSVSQRTKEIGIRMALGAQEARILRTVMGEGLRMVGWGMAIGIPLAVLLGWLIQATLFEVEPYDASTLASIAVVMAAAGLLACWIPARRATQVDPMVALRYE